MKCIAEGCQGSAIGGNYCPLHRRKTVSPRPGVSGIFRVKIRNKIPEIQEIDVSEELAVKLGGKIKKKIKGGNVIIYYKRYLSKGKIINYNKIKIYPGLEKIKRLPRGRKLEEN